MQYKDLNLLVISDPHAHSGDPLTSNASYYSTDTRFQSVALNPFSGIADLIKSEGLHVDWVVSPGDLGDKADPSAQQVAWKELHDIKDRLAASALIGTTGNHDVDSRRARKEFDPKGALQSLFPTFPLEIGCYVEGDNVYADRFWSKNFVVVPFEHFDTTLVVINSSAFHGYSSEVKKAPTEHLHGRLSPQTIEAIKEAIRSVKTAVNIVLLHHHVKPHPWIEDGGSVAKGGELLVEMLKESGKRWLIVHGHQHVPHLSYADASPFAPVVLSAGSVAAKTYLVRGKHARNQIHHIKLNPNDSSANGVHLFGQVRSWTWSPHIGWTRAQRDAGLPYICGFGFRKDLTEVRDQLLAVANKAPNRLVRWEELIGEEPRLYNMMPDDQEGLIKIIKEKGGKVQFDDQGQPSYLEGVE
jgi:3',5'-cyclic AMP phosphodiesterase CpdA